MYALFNFRPLPATTSEGKIEFPRHSSLFIRGTDTDGPLRIEVRHDLVGGNLEYRVLDYSEWVEEGDGQDANACSVGW